jgi:arabinose-5-phosphate isomerase
MKSAETMQRVFQEEIAALQTVSNRLGDLDALIQSVFACRGRVVVTGMGKSGLIGRKISATFSSTATPSTFVHPAEALHGDLGVISNEDFVLAISNSGETEEVIALIPFLRRRGVPIAALCCKKKSTLAEKCDFLVHLPVEREADSFSLVPTCTTTAMLVTGDALAVAVLEKRGLTREQFAELHPSGSLGRKLLLQIGDIMHAGEKKPLVHLGMTLREAVCIMGEKRLGVAFVVDPIAPEKLLGIITDGDLRRLLSQNANPLGERVEKVMTADPITVDSQELAVTAVNMMQNNKITVLPVMQGGQLAGAVHLHDLLRAGLG